MTSGARPSGTLYIAGKPFHTDAPIINWLDPGGWDASTVSCIATRSDPTPPCRPGGVPYGQVDLAVYGQDARRYGPRPALRVYGNALPPVEAVQAAIRQCVIHHDGCGSSDEYFSILHNERGLSVHFLVDNDGTIYQTLDLALMAFHAGYWNPASIGIALCNRGDALAQPTFYAAGHFGPKRDVTRCVIHGHVIEAFDYTSEQYDSLAYLVRSLRKLLPNLPVEFPQIAPGQQAWEALAPSVSFPFSGYLGHYHVNASHWDPGPFPFANFFGKLRGISCFPMFGRPDASRASSTLPAAANTTDDLSTQAADLYRANEQRADGGFFPVGPWGSSRLWHGGVHLVGNEGDPVVAPFSGRLVLARMGASSPIGSTNFVLLRHDMMLGQEHLRFHSLYMHLADELHEAKPVDWVVRSGGGPGLVDLGQSENAPVAGQITMLDQPIEAGEVIGRIGRAGPAGASRPQVHVEIMSAAQLFARVPDAPWQLIDGSAGGRFCDSPEIDKLIDDNGDGLLSAQELKSFYSGGGASAMHFLVTLHVSEWAAEPAWSVALKAAKDFRGLKPDEIDRLIADQITPGLWWDDAAARHAELSPDGYAYHYHPIAFVSWIQQQVLDARALARARVPASTDARRATELGLVDDFRDADSAALRASDPAQDPCNQRLTLDQLVQGYDAARCSK